MRICCFFFSLLDISIPPFFVFSLWGLVDDCMTITCISVFSSLFNTYIQDLSTFSTAVSCKFEISLTLWSIFVKQDHFLLFSVSCFPVGCHDLKCLFCFLSAHLFSICIDVSSRSQYKVWISWAHWHTNTEMSQRELRAEQSQKSPHFCISADFPLLCLQLSDVNL